MKKALLILFFPLFLFANSSILVINSYHKGYEFSDKIISGIENVLYPNTQIDINILYMDSKRVTSKEYYESLEKLYAVQLKNRKYDLIITVDRFAYDFVLKIYKEFFTTEPILTVGIENFSKENAKKYNVEEKVSALLEKRDLKANVKAIKKLMPSIKKLYIINDKSENALHTEPLILELLNSFYGDYELIYLKEDSLEDLTNKFSVFKENEAALFIRFYKNKNGELNKNHSIANFIKNAKTPIFITDSIFIKKGATGGKIVDLYKFGQESGQMALDILKKQEFKVVVFSDLDYVFDAKKLEEFTLPVDALNVEYKIVNKRETFYDKHRGFINFVFTISPFLILLIIGLVRNIYIRKKVEKELTKQIEFNTTLLSAIESPIIWQDSNGIIADTNARFSALVNLYKDNLKGKRLEDFIENQNIRKIIKILEKIKTENLENIEFKYFDENKKRKIYLVKQTKYEDKKTNTKGIVTIFTDITKQKEVEIEKQRNRQFTIQQSKLAEIGEVFSSIAHQWKSPLVEITAIAQEIFYTKKCENVKEDDSFVSDIMKQVNYMTDTINDFQKFIIPSHSKVKFEIDEAINSMLEIVNHNMKYNNIKISLEVEEGSLLTINGFKNEFMQSFLNIINNSKDALLNNDYKNRKIDINLSNEEEKLVIKIKDNAGGIDNKNIHKIFKPYFTTKDNGHGIGLYMSKMIIEDKMGGNLSAQNIDNGAMFVIKLDLDK